MMEERKVREMQEWIVTVDNDVLTAVVSVSIAEMAVRYGSEKIETVISNMLMLDEFHELAALARGEREEQIDVVDMIEHDIVAEARAILDES